MKKLPPHWQQRQHPLWQRRRLEIMQRDGFKCVECGNGERQLQVHHRWYVSGRFVWEYPDVALRTLCDECHAAPSPNKKAEWFEVAVALVEAASTKADFDIVNQLGAEASRRGVEPSDLLATQLSILGAGQ